MSALHTALIGTDGLTLIAVIIAIPVIAVCLRNAMRRG
ncbi:hypothetical protein HME9302_00955 [Alteripontixanthobacter maritimus]|uniref:Uncharacterized protein n=1 Tax=Alteripontixanthobacter maritimus TaxID=2161824 RepID=A0A369Q5Q7_9SPHN|nr:hypothetical protein HME9302_00955 [Alteripontixanthobacter maritimus]